MYTIHNIKAYIISVTPRSDADHLMICVSDEYGLMYVSIKGSRKEQSKHRFVAQPFTFARVHCIKGKAGWRLTGIEEVDRISKDSVVLPCFINLSNLIAKLVHGEESGILFSILHDGWRSFVDGSFTKEEAPFFERVIALRILHSLGYVGESSVTNPFLKDTHLNAGILNQVQQNIKPITAAINTSIRATGLS